MSRTRPADMSASIRQRLLNLSRERNEVFNVVLMRYALERLLYRLARSGHAEDFVLKGAMLFTAWTEKLHRPTKDLDLLGHGNDSGEHLKALFQKICQVEVEPDGLVFDKSTVRVERDPRRPGVSRPAHTPGSPFGQREDPCPDRRGIW